MKKVNRRRMDDSTPHNVWRSFSDMMSGLLLLFVLIMAVCLMQAQKNYTEKLAEQAKQSQTLSELQASQSQVSEQQEKLSEQEATLAEQASALETLQAALEAHQLSLNEKETELENAQLALDAQTLLLNERESELALSQASLSASQLKLDEANALMLQQQSKIDQIIGVKADLVAALNDEFKKNSISVQIDSNTGAILLDSSVLFEFSESELTSAGMEVLDQVLEPYCEVLLREEYVNYIAEIIIDGYTDSSGDYQSNLMLSQQRAYAVAAYLTDTMYQFLSGPQTEILLGKLTANGKSSSNLILEADGRENADASRRVEIKFRLKDEEMISELQKLIVESQAAAGGETAVAEAAAEQE
ncbi:MAG: OmpA family protein [Lachnospiraceae bacterium]|nr:OmpA family protein [Lachnospiraceae bacterium]